MILSKTMRRAFLSLLGSLLLFSFAHSEEVPHTLALGATVIGAQLHWGFSRKSALEIRMLKHKENNDTTENTLTAYAYGLRTYRYFKPIMAGKRTRLYMGLEAASTRSTSSTYDYKTTGFALGGFGGTEIYVLRRLSLGFDLGPYVVSSKVRGSDTSSGEILVVVNTYMNFYFL
ncbi:MAG: hypothetical protein ACKVQC_07695 [Elusimicrobiota bacterium]